MRWPWSREPGEDPAPAAPAAAPAAAAAAPADPAPSPMGWAFLPPIQRTLDTPIAPVTRPTTFPAELPAWRSPAFTSTLSHAVVDTVPGGVVDGDGNGLGEPSHTVGPAPELTLLPPPRPTAIQRAVADPAAEEPAPGPALTRAPSVGMPVVHRSVVADPSPLEEVDPPAPTADVAPDEMPDLPDRPDRPDRPALTASAAVPEPMSPSPSTGTTAAPVAVQRSASAPLAPRLPDPLPVQRATPSDLSTPVAKPRLGLGAPLLSAPETAVPAPPESYDDRALPVVRAPETPASPASPASPTTPISPAEVAEAGFTEVPIQRALAPRTPTAVPSSRPAPARPEVQPPAEPPAPELTLARSVDPAVEPSAPPASVTDPRPKSTATPGTAPAPVPAEGTADDPLIADAVGLPKADPEVEQLAPAETSPVDPPPAILPSAPLPLPGGITTSIQRADLLPGPGSPTPSLVVRPAPLVPQKPARARVVPIQRLPAESAHPTPHNVPTRLNSSRAGSTRVPPSPPLQRSAAPYALADVPLPEVVNTTTAPMRPVEPATRVKPTEIARSIAPAPTPSALPGPVVSRSLEPSPVRAARSASPIALPPPSIQSPSMPAAVPPTMPLAAPPVSQAPVSVQTAADDEPVAAPAPDPAAGPPDGSTATTGPGPVTVQTAAAPATAAAGPAAAPGKGGGSATGDVDALAQKLFPAVLRRIKSELLLDRERRGVRTDPW
jgi:hypothetical protein